MEALGGLGPAGTPAGRGAALPGHRAELRRRHGPLVAHLSGRGGSEEQPAGVCRPPSHLPAGDGGLR